jgi:DNA-binding GntR family transcriptional regulator
VTRALSATDRAYTETKRSILDGHLVGGDVITEGQISTLLGISRTPVREAFLRLQSEGLLQLYPKRGAVVVPVEPSEVFAVMEAREIIESFAITKLLTEHARVPRTVIESLWALVGEMTQALHAQDPQRFAIADAEFHQALVATSANPFLDQLAASLTERLWRFMPRVGRAERLESAYREHIQLVEWIERGDLDATLAALRSHLRAGLMALTGRPPRGTEK